MVKISKARPELARLYPMVGDFVYFEPSSRFEAQSGATQKGSESSEDESTENETAKYSEVRKLPEDVLRQHIQSLLAAPGNATESSNEKDSMTKPEWLSVMSEMGAPLSSILKPSAFDAFAFLAEPLSTLWINVPAEGIKTSIKGARLYELQRVSPELAFLVASLDAFGNTQDLRKAGGEGIQAMIAKTEKDEVGLGQISIKLKKLQEDVENFNPHQEKSFWLRFGKSTEEARKKNIVDLNDRYTQLVKERQVYFSNLDTQLSLQKEALDLQRQMPNIWEMGGVISQEVIQWCDKNLSLLESQWSEESLNTDELNVVSNVLDRRKFLENLKRSMLILQSNFRDRKQLGRPLEEILRISVERREEILFNVQNLFKNTESALLAATSEISSQEESKEATVVTAQQNAIASRAVKSLASNQTQFLIMGDKIQVEENLSDRLGGRFLKRLVGGTPESRTKAFNEKWKSVLVEGKEGLTPLKLAEIMEDMAKGILVNEINLKSLMNHLDLHHPVALGALLGILAFHGRRSFAKDVASTDFNANEPYLLMDFHQSMDGLVSRDSMGLIREIVTANRNLEGLVADRRAVHKNGLMSLDYLLPESLESEKNLPVVNVVPLSPAEQKGISGFLLKETHLWGFSIGDALGNVPLDVLWPYIKSDWVLSLARQDLGSWILTATGEGEAQNEPAELDSSYGLGWVAQLLSRVNESESTGQKEARRFRIEFAQVLTSEALEKHLKINPEENFRNMLFHQFSQLSQGGSTFDVWRAYLAWAQPLWKSAYEQRMKNEKRLYWSFEKEMRVVDLGVELMEHVYWLALPQDQARQFAKENLKTWAKDNDELQFLLGQSLDDLMVYRSKWLGKKYQEFYNQTKKEDPNDWAETLASRLMPFVRLSLEKKHSDRLIQIAESSDSSYITALSRRRSMDALLDGMIKPIAAHDPLKNEIQQPLNKIERAFGLDGHKIFDLKDAVDRYAEAGWILGHDVWSGWGNHKAWVRHCEMGQESEFLMRSWLGVLSNIHMKIQPNSEEDAVKASKMEELYWRGAVSTVFVLSESIKRFSSAVNAQEQVAWRRQIIQALEDQMLELLKWPEMEGHQFKAPAILERFKEKDIEKYILGIQINKIEKEAYHKVKSLSVDDATEVMEFILMQKHPSNKEGSIVTTLSMPAREVVMGLMGLSEGFYQAEKKIKLDWDRLRLLEEAMSEHSELSSIAKNILFKVGSHDVKWDKFKTTEVIALLKEKVPALPIHENYTYLDLALVTQEENTSEKALQKQAFEWMLRDVRTWALPSKSILNVEVLTLGELLWKDDILPSLSPKDQEALGDVLDLWMPEHLLMVKERLGTENWLNWPIDEVIQGLSADEFINFYRQSLWVLPGGQQEPKEWIDAFEYIVSSSKSPLIRALETLNNKEYWMNLTKEMVDETLGRTALLTAIQNRQLKETRQSRVASGQPSPMQRPKI